MAQAETEYWQEQEEKARQHKSVDPDRPGKYADIYLQWFNQMVDLDRTLVNLYKAMAGLAFLFALETLALAFLIWKVVR